MSLTAVAARAERGRSPNCSHLSHKDTQDNLGTSIKELKKWSMETGALHTTSGDLSRRARA